MGSFALEEDFGHFLSCQVVSCTDAFDDESDLFVRWITVSIANRGDRIDSSPIMNSLNLWLARYHTSGRKRVSLHIVIDVSCLCWRTATRLSLPHLEVYIPL